MTAKSNSQKQRFIDRAREIEACEDPSVFDRLFSKIVPPKKAKRKAKQPNKDES